MKLGRPLGMMLALAVLVVCFTKVLLLKNMTVQQPFAQTLELLRTFESDEAAIERFRQPGKPLFEAVCFPVPFDGSGGQTTVYENSWMHARNYGGERVHEGCDIMSSLNEPDYFPVQSVCDGKVEKLGWLPLGGYRVGIRSASGTFYYYAHLSSYAQGLKEGDDVKAGQTIGKMGNTGYGPEGTTGKFDVHLHFGIYISWKGEDISINPYPVLKYLEENRKTFYQNGE